MKYLALFLFISCATPETTTAPNKPVQTPPRVTIGGCFISADSDVIYKIVRCNNYYCRVKNQYMETTMERGYVSKQLTTQCPKEIK